MVAEWAKVKFLVHLKLEDPSWISGLERPSFMPNLDRKVQGINPTTTKIYLLTIQYSLSLLNLILYIDM